MSSLVHSIRVICSKYSSQSATTLICEIDIKVKGQPIFCGSVAEWSKALDLGSSLYGGVGSNPTTASAFCSLISIHSDLMLIEYLWLSVVHGPSGLMDKALPS